MLAIISLLIVVFLSILVTRIATLALTHTGMSREAARFQARSAFTGSGFTTREAEMVVNHPLRRRIVMLLMLVGNAGIVTAVSSLILTFIDPGASQGVTFKVVLLVAGLTGLWLLASSEWISRHLNRLINWGLGRFTKLDVTDYASLLHLVGEYQLAELEIQPDDWLVDKTLKSAALRAEGVNVLGVQRGDGTYLGSPNGETMIRQRDVLIVYGRATALQELDQRRRGYLGDVKHRRAAAQQQGVIEEEKALDREPGEG